MNYRRRHPRALTLLEVIIAMFIFLVGIVGVLAAMPTGVNSATWVIFQDSAIHLAHSKFTEFRRDRIDPNVDLVPTPGGYLPTTTPYAKGKQEPYNSGTGDDNPWRDFAHNPSDPYQYFEDVDRYEWKVETQPIENGVSAPTDVVSAPAGSFFPVPSKNNPSPINLVKVSVTIRMKSTTREMKFSQLFYSYGQL